MGDDGAACVRIHPSNVDVDEFDPELVRAVADGAPASKVKRLLQNGADVNAVTSHGWSALYLAVLNSDLDNVKLLLKWGAHTSYIDEDGDDSHQCGARSRRWIRYAAVARGCPRGSDCWWSPRGGGEGSPECGVRGFARLGG